MIFAGVVLFVSILAFVILPYDPFGTRYFPVVGETVHYWWLLAKNQLGQITFLVPIILLILFAVSMASGLRGARTCREWVMTIAPFLMLLLIIALLSFGLLLSDAFADGTRLTHVETINHDTSTYHLAHGNTTAGGWDVFFSRYLVYECASLDSACRLIYDYELECSYTSDCEPEMEAHLRVAEGKLYLVVDQEKVLLMTS